MVDIYEKIGNYALDISKYVFTGVIITTFFRNFGSSDILIYLAGFFVAFGFMLIAYWSYGKHNDKERKRLKTKKGVRI